MADLLTRRAALEPTTANDTERTVDVVWSTGAGVKRRDAAGLYEERLSLDPQHVNVARLVGAPVLDGHRQDSVDRVLGVVTAAHTDGSAGHATLRFSERAEPIWNDIKAGILRAVSVGYSVEKWSDSGANGTRVRTAVQWTPREVSLVPLPADAGAGVRGEPMEDDDVTPTPDDATATRAETNRTIRQLVAAAKLDRSVADDLVDRATSVDDAKRELFDLVTRQPPVTVRHQRIELGTDHGPEALVARMADALHARMTGAEPTDAAREFMHARLADMARDLLEARGERTRLWSPDTLLRRAGQHTSGDFPTLLTSVRSRHKPGKGCHNTRTRTLSRSCAPLPRLARGIQHLIGGRRGIFGARNLPSGRTAAPPLGGPRAAFLTRTVPGDYAGSAASSAGGARPLAASPSSVDSPR